MRRQQFRCFPAVPLTLVILLWAGPELAAAPPRDELLRFVPQETAVCLVIQGLREQAKAVGDSPFAAWIAEKLGPKLTATQEFSTLKSFEKLIEEKIGIGVAELRDDILGDAIVLAYQPGPPGKPEAESGAVLLKARAPDKLRKLIDRVNALQTEREEIKEVKKYDYKGKEYFRRVRPNGEGDFYLLRDGLFVFSAQEAAIRAVIDQAATPPTQANSMAESFKLAGVPDAFLTCWVNPRRLDADLAANTAAAKDPSRRAFLEQLGRVWAGIDGLAIYLDVRKEAEFGVAVALTPDRLPAEIRPLLASPVARSEVWRLVPESALAAVGGRVDVPAVIAAISSFAPADERDAIRAAVERNFGALVGKPNLAPALTKIGPDWGFWIAPPAGSGTWVPDWTAAVRVRDPADRALLKVMGFWTSMFLFDYNQKHDDQIEAREERLGGIDITSLGNDKAFPPGFQPAYAVKNGYLVVAGSPAAVNRFPAPKPAGQPTGETPILRLSATAIRAYLREQRGPFGKWFAEFQGKSEENVLNDLGKLADVLEPFDRIEVLVRGDERRFGVAVRTRLIKPLAK